MTESGRAKYTLRHVLAKNQQEKHHEDLHIRTYQESMPMPVELGGTAARDLSR